MSKTGGSYDSVILGVSEQVPQNRRSGQHEAQTNLLSDPVHGLTRRRGSVYKDELALGAGDLDALADDLGNMKEFSFVIDGIEYSLVYRTTASLAGDDTFMFAYNKATDQFMPVVYQSSTWVDDLISGGVSAITSAGRYVYIAGWDTIPEIDITDVWNTTDNLEKMVAWVRGGAYSRTFTLTLTKTDDTTVSVSYTTMPSSYPGILDTSDIPFSDPEYQKLVNDRVNEFNGAATNHIGIAAQDITGENIAQKLVDELLLVGVAASRQEATVLIDDADYVDISADDGGDNTLIRAVGMEVSSPTLMSTIHYVGKVVRIRPEGAGDANSYYLKAYARGEVATGWAEVIWREAAGVTQEPTLLLSQGIVHEGTFYLAQDGAGLAAIAPTSGDHPAFKASTVGDPASSPTPYYYGRVITMLSVFQDRLVIGCDNVINMSRSGDYLNYFRQTILNILDNDPIEMYAFGAEGDTLRSTVMYDKDLLIFGDLKQYGISGRSVLSAKSPNVTTSSAFADATSARPIASGDFVFFGKNAEGDEGDIRTTLHQVQTGQVLESLTNYEVSAQLDQYIQGTPIQLVGMTSPNLILYRTREQPHTIYTYTYLDNQGGSQRLFDAWNKWEYAEVLGTVCGLSSFRGAVLVFSVRTDGDNLYVVADKQSLNGELGRLPYLDSQRPYVGLDGWHAAADDEQLYTAIDAGSPRFLIGTRLDKSDVLLDQLPDQEEFMWVGAISPARVTPTNPYPRDSNGKAITTGRQTISVCQVSVTDTSGLTASVETVNGTIVTTTFQGRVLGLLNNLIAQQPHPTTVVSVGVGRETREFKYHLDSKDWLPLTITAISWEGQRFDRIRR